MKRKLTEELVQSFQHRCPYCDQTLSYDAFDLKPGENPIACPSCQKVFIKMISDSVEEGKHK